MNDYLMKRMFNPEVNPATGIDLNAKKGPKKVILWVARSITEKQLQNLNSPAGLVHKQLPHFAHPAHLSELCRYPSQCEEGASADRQSIQVLYRLRSFKPDSVS